MMKLFGLSRREKRAKVKQHSSFNESDNAGETSDNVRDETIDFSEIPELTPEQFAKAIVRKGLKPQTGKQQITLRLDTDVLDWFKGLGKGYQTRINELLRAYMEAHRPK